MFLEKKINKSHYYNTLHFTWNNKYSAWLTLGACARVTVAFPAISGHGVIFRITTSIFSVHVCKENEWRHSSFVFDGCCSDNSTRCASSQIFIGKFRLLSMVRIHSMLHPLNFHQDIRSMKNAYACLNCRCMFCLQKRAKSPYLAHFVHL